MGMYIVKKKLLIKTGPKTFYFDSDIKIKNSLEHEIDSIIKRNEFLVDYGMKNKIRQLLFK